MTQSARLRSRLDLPRTPLIDTDLNLISQCMSHLFTPICDIQTSERALPVCSGDGLEIIRTSVVVLNLNYGNFGL